MPHVAIFLSIILVSSLFLNNSYGLSTGDIEQNKIPPLSAVDFDSGIVNVYPPLEENQKMKRYLIFGSGSLEKIKTITNNLIYSAESQNGFFTIGIIDENKIPQIQSNGFHVLEDVRLDFHESDVSEVSKIGEITGSEKVFEKFGYNGSGIKIAIVDTGVDFSNPDIIHSLARDKNNHPIMLDADGQGIILTNSTFFAFIDDDGIVRNYTKSLPKDTTSSVYRTKSGVFLDINQNGNGTIIPIYNSFFPQAGSSPIFNGTLTEDMKIGHNSRDYIVSKSGIYHLGVMYQGALQGSLTRIQVVPVLVVDSNQKGVYDTIIPDMSTSWKDYSRFDLPAGEKPDYDFDFTDEKPIVLGSGNEFLLYDFDDDGKNDYSAGTIGAKVLDVYGIIENKTAKIEDTLKAVNGSLLPAMDSSGQFFGVMTDFLGHGTSSASSIVSRGIQEYNIYNNTEKFTIKGTSPGAKIIPVKALWFGDTVYAWLWAAGFDNQENSWKFSGNTRADIISNSWGISNFPSFEYAPGYDILSIILSVLVTPNSLDNTYPGITIVSSAGNSGHGYGTIGMPNASPFGISVGATTNNVFVGYGPFKEQPRFGNTTDHANHVVDFSSRGPGIIGDPKPDVMSIGAHSFTPSQVTKLEKDSGQESFSLFGGTSMAAPLVSGSAALLMQGLQEKDMEYDSFKIKNILMSTASDLQNDPFTQGSGLSNIENAINFVHGEKGFFIVHNNASYSNIKNMLQPSIDSFNSTSLGVKRFQIPDKKFPHASWYGGQLFPGEKTKAVFTIENPSDESLELKISSESLKLIKNSQFSGTTQVQEQDPILNKSGVYSPNYIRLSDIKQYKDISSYFDDSNPIPADSSLLILNVNFPFESFMNKTDDVYANDLMISSLYLYDWIDKNNDTDVSSDELSMINRAGSWGTVQEMRVTEPNSQFENIPLVGIYPVPTRLSYWLGDTKLNSTSMDYTLTSNYYKKNSWDLVWISNDNIIIPPKESSSVSVTLTVPTNYESGIYQGFLKFESDLHSANIPVSFAVKQKIEKDSLILFNETKNVDPIFGQGYVKGAFDMINRYMAGDWRQYYFDIDDPIIDTGLIQMSWKNNDTNFSVFVMDPQGKIIQTNMPSGVFGHFLGWTSLDWLGTSAFSQGGGFFPVKNKNDTSTVLAVPINQTGTYSILVHSTLFGGNSTTEPISITGKFTSLLSDKKDFKIPTDVTLHSKEVIIEEIVPSEITPEESEFLEDTIMDIDKNMIQKDESIDESNPILFIGLGIAIVAIIAFLIRKKLKIFQK